MSGLDPFGNGQKFLTSFLHVAPCTFAIQQCHFGAITPKPTRFLGTFAVTDARCHFGLPRFDKQGLYKGPLPKSCGHTHKHKLLGKTASKWNTSPSASYPPALCEFLSLLVLHAGASCGRGTTKRVMREVPLLHRLFLAREAPANFQVREVPKFYRLFLTREVPAIFW